MQVSYRRNGRYNTGTKNLGRRNGNISNSGGVGAGSKANNRPSRYGAEESSRMAETGKEGVANKNSKKNMSANEGGKIGI